MMRSLTALMLTTLTTPHPQTKHKNLRKMMGLFFDSALAPDRLINIPLAARIH